MGFDIRLPIGMMFSVFGVLVGGYGAATRGSEMYTRHSLGINVNLWWGNCNADVRCGNAAARAPWSSGGALG